MTYPHLRHVPGVRARFLSLAVSALVPALVASLAGTAISARADDATPSTPAASSSGSASGTASSSATPGSTTSDSALPAVVIKGGKEQLPGDLSPTFGGNQVAKGANIGVLGQQNLIDVPYSVTAYTAKLIDDQQAHTVADVVANDPAVRTAYGYGTFAETYVIRGFEVYSDDVSLNGLYGLTPRQLVDTGALERVDIFKGANAFVNGAAPGGSGVGGNINLETKYAGDKPLTSVTVEGSASGELGTHVDVGRRFGADDQFGIRVNQTVEGGETSIDDEKRHTQQTAISLDYRGSQFRLYGDFIYQKEHVADGRPVVYVDGTTVPTAPSATSNYGQPWTYYTMEDTIGMLRAEYDITPTWTVYASGGVRHTHESSDTSSPYYGTGGATSAYRFDDAFVEQAKSLDVGVRGKFDTGPISHAVNLSGLINQINTYGAYDFGGYYTTSLYGTPSVALPAASAPSGDFADPGLTASSLMRSVAVSDTMGFFQNRFLFTVGLRRQNIVENGYEYGTGTQDSAYNESATTPIFGAVYKITQDLSVYANRSESLTEGGTAPSSAANAGAVLSPYRAKQIEAGVKYDAGNYGAALAVYQIKQPVAYTDSVTNVYSADGVQRHRGIELSAYGEPYKGVRLIGGVSYIDAKLEDTDEGTYNGNRPVGVPAWTANANIEYDLPQVPGVTLMGRAIYTSSQYLDEANTLKVPSWTRFDLGARYHTTLFKRDTTFRVMVTNIANRSYWSSALGGYLTEAAPRTAWFSLTTAF